MKRSMLNLSFMENATDDLLDSPINEGTEGTENNIETDPIESTKVDVPGGDKEEPSKQGIKLDADTYNSALDALQKSFNEGAQIAAMLKNAQITEDSLESKQAQFTEAAIEDALLASFENGPMFESVKKADKKEVKDIVTKIRKSIFTYLKGKDIRSTKPAVIARLLFDLNANFSGTNVKIYNGNTIIYDEFNLANTYLWQVLALVEAENDEIDDIVKDLINKYKEELGEYTIISYQTGLSSTELARLNKMSKDSSKNKKQAFMLFVDKTLPKKEAKELDKALTNALKAPEGEKDKK